MTSQRLYRSRSDRMIFGICGGLAQYFSIDTTIVRLFFVLGAIFSHGAIGLAYLVMRFVIPQEYAGASSSFFSDEGLGAGGPTDPAAGSKGPPTFDRPDFGSYGRVGDDDRERRHQWIGWGLLGLGLIILVSNLHLLSWLNFNVTWPLFLIVAGVFLL
ncbi:MAG TPA: PspC domain-containing protein, partial [Chloroflexota bacterium]|nr:PspC domain-containing protein [Chloroflexota bacterium]